MSGLLEWSKPNHSAINKKITIFFVNLKAFKRRL